MRCDRPNWLNTDFVETVLKNTEGDPRISVILVLIEPIEEDNYGSMVFRIIVDFSRGKREVAGVERKSMIVKTASTAECLLKDMIEKTESFETEIRMLETTLGKMNDILKATSDYNYRLNPKVLHTRICEQSVLVMEDLMTSGFRKMTQQILPDLPHFALAIRRIAKFHASSVALWEKEPDSVTTYNKGLYSTDYPEYYRKFYAESIRNIANEVIKWTELGPNAEIYHDKLTKISEVCWDRVVECTQPRENEFNVLNHGDCATKNMLFRYDANDKLIDHIFIDFQTSVWCSPALDLLTFFSLAFGENVNSHGRERLLHEYLDVLTDTMKQIECRTKPPSLLKFKDSLRKRGIYEIIATCVILPLMMLQDKHESTSFDEFILQASPHASVNRIEKGSCCRLLIMNRLFDWDSRGLLDAALTSSFA